MSVYDISGTELHSVYGLGGLALQSAYDVEGSQIYSPLVPPVDPDDPYLEGRTLVFYDDFDSFDTNNWGYETGYQRNNELQYYLSRNVACENSCLVLTAKRETYRGYNWRTQEWKDFAWTSGSITSQTKKFWKYGRIQAKIKFPRVAGSFGAFWMLGTALILRYQDETTGEWIGEGTGNIAEGSTAGWPACGEIDIDESIPGNASTARSNLWKADSGSSFGGGSSNSINIGDWHIYEIEWTKDYIAALVDGVEYKRWTFANYSASEYEAYLKPFYIILNHAVGASGGTPASTTNEMKMMVDWVRVYAPLSS